MHQLAAPSLETPGFASRRGSAGPILSLAASLGRWRRRASLAAIARALSDASLNPYLFQIESCR